MPPRRTPGLPDEFRPRPGPPRCRCRRPRSRTSRRRSATLLKRTKLTPGITGARTARGTFPYASLRPNPSYGHGNCAPSRESPCRSSCPRVRNTPACARASLSAASHASVPGVAEEDTVQPTHLRQPQSQLGRVLVEEQSSTVCSRRLLCVDDRRFNRRVRMPAPAHRCRSADPDSRCPAHPAKCTPLPLDKENRVALIRIQQQASSPVLD